MVEREFRHAGMNVQWRLNCPQETMGSFQTEIDGHFTSSSNVERREAERQSRDDEGPAGLIDGLDHGVQAIVARHFRGASRMDPLTELELGNACQNIIAADNRLRAERNSLGEDHQIYRRERNDAVQRVCVLNGQVGNLTKQVVQVQSYCVG